MLYILWTPILTFSSKGLFFSFLSIAYQFKNQISWYLKTNIFGSLRNLNKLRRQDQREGNSKNHMMLLISPLAVVLCFWPYLPSFRATLPLKNLDKLYITYVWRQWKSTKDSENWGPAILDWKKVQSYYLHVGDHFSLWDDYWFKKWKQ